MRNLHALVELLEARARTPFAWGSRAQDCVSFAAAAVRAQTGLDLIERCGHQWSTARGAARVLRRIGGVAAAADLVLEQIAPGSARRGDVGLVELDGRASLVVFEGDTLVGPGDAGLVRLPRSAAELAWSLDRVRA